MTRELILRDASDVEAALLSGLLVPPPAAPNLGSGSIRRLREQMARFSHGPEHADRRREVEQAIARIDPDKLRATATARTLNRLDTAPVDAYPLGFVIPTEALAIELAVTSMNLAEVMRDTEVVVRSVGRGEVVDVAADDASNRLEAEFANHPDGPVAAVSLLYQVFDSTAALFAVTLLARQTQVARRNALAGTVRVALGDTNIGQQSIVRGDVVRISLEAEGLEFGAGPHLCPGVELAWAIVNGMIEALKQRGLELVESGVRYRSDGRPETLPMEIRTGVGQAG